MDWKTATAISAACECLFPFFLQARRIQAIFGIRSRRRPRCCHASSLLDPVTHSRSLFPLFSFPPKQKKKDVGGVLGGKRLMKHRKPFNVKPFAVVHNAVMFSLSLYMVVETLSQAYVNFGWAKKLSPWGNMVESPGSAKFSPSGYRLARVLWIHYLSKVYEFADTAIMVLKKNERQISFLHVYHHASTFFPCWCVFSLFFVFRFFCFSFGCALSPASFCSVRAKSGAKSGAIAKKLSIVSFERSERRVSEQKKDELALFSLFSFSPVLSPL